jgi:RHS repeat-associated protein
MTQSLKTPPKTSLRPLFLRKRGFLIHKKGGKPPKIPGAVAYRGNLFQKKFTGKERDPETGLYYYGARYLDPKTSRWLSGDPALGEYFPSAPVDDQAKKRNQNLPGMGGVFNVVNMHAYYYAGNNPVKYTDPDGEKVKNKTSRYIYIRFENAIPNPAKEGGFINGKMLAPGETYKEGKVDGAIVYNEQTGEKTFFKVTDSDDYNTPAVGFNIKQRKDGSYRFPFRGISEILSRLGDIKKDPRAVTTGIYVMNLEGELPENAKGIKGMDNWFPDALEDNYDKIQEWEADRQEKLNQQNNNQQGNYPEG